MAAWMIIVVDYNNVVKNNVTLLIIFVKWNKCVSMNKLEQMLHEALNIYIFRITVDCMKAVCILWDVISGIYVTVYSIGLINFCQVRTR